MFYTTPGEDIIKISMAIVQDWDNMSNDNINYHGKKNKLITGIQDEYTYYPNSENYDFELDNYVNFDRLYENIVAEQSGIKEGTKLSVGSDGVLHIPTGGTYTIEDISNVK